MRGIELTRGFAALVDDEDFEKLSQFNWRYIGVHGRGYAARVVRVNGRQKSILMHTEIIQPPEGFEVDHRNGLGIDNRRSNLRIATHSQNCCNQKVRKTNKLGVKGVCFHKRSKKFRASITKDGKYKHLGFFDTISAAKAAYEKAAINLHGEFSRLN